jgi:tRNA(Ser,Leu) C12 N-acetylase TAN1
LHLTKTAFLKRRRGFKGKIYSQEEGRFLDMCLLDALEKAGTSGRVAFDDPDHIIAVETVGSWAGISLWRREDLHRYPFIRLDLISSE